jgi:cytochrome c-type biogenesis protein CcmH
MTLRNLWLALALAFTVAMPAMAVDPLPFKDHAEEARFQVLTGQLRCLVCQNESLADSNADLARDLRHEVFELMQQGKSDGEIKAYLVARYSKFVLYDPPLDGGTALLWFGPAIVLLLGAGALAMQVRKRARAAAAAPAAATAASNDIEEDW